MNSFSGSGNEPSLVDEMLPALSARTHLGSCFYTDESLNSWSSYASLSEACRGAYLDFLASDRSDPTTPIKYILLYFYGLEKRVIESIENKLISDSEFIILFEEVMRLIKLFNENYSIELYSANLLEFMALLRPILLKNRIHEIPKTENNMLFKVKLATLIEKRLSIDANLALDWLIDSKKYNLRVPMERCENEFNKLFKLSFREEFGSGLLLKRNKTKLLYTYKNINPSINRINLDLQLPDPDALSAPINKLILIADDCNEKLNSYSRYLGGIGTSKNDIAALILLPKEITTEFESTVFESFKLWAEQVVERNKGLTTFKEVWAYTGMPLPKNINKKEIELLTNLAEKANIGIAPDDRFHFTKYKSDGSIVFFLPCHDDSFEASSEFHLVMLALHFGVMVATIGNLAHEKELILRRLIKDNGKLKSIERSSLSAYLTWLLNSPLNSVGLSARIKLLNTTQVQFIKNIIILIALADGKIEPSEIKQIEKLYSSLGLDKSLVVSDIHNLTAIKKPFPILDLNSEQNNDSFQLNEEVLAMHESDTNVAKLMLTDIFAVEDEPESEQIGTLIIKQGSLDNNHKALFELLIIKKIWPYKEVHELCRKLNLMVDGAIETINDWAYEQVDAPVLDVDGDIYVDLEIVKELKE